MKALTLDLETYYDSKYSLSRLTIAEYVHDPRFHVHGLAIRWPDGRTEFRADVPAALKELQTAFGTRLERVTTVFHNAYFDMYVLRHRFGITVGYFVDTMLLSHHVDGRKGEGGESASLADVAKRYGLNAKGDLSFLRGIRNPTPRQLADLASYAVNDVNITYQLLNLLPRWITRPEVEIPIMQHAVRLFVERSIVVDTAGIDRLASATEAETAKWFSDALAQLKASRVLSGEDADEQAGVDRLKNLVSKDRTFVELLKCALERTGRLLPLKQGKHGLIPATAKKDPAMQELLHDADPVVAALAHARTGKKSEDQILAKLNTLRRVTTATGGGLPPYLLYGGASTLRFSGGQRFNIQNLGKSGLGLAMRRLLMAREGHVLVIGDLAQIEARVLAWLAGEDELLANFAAGKDIYSEFATEVLNEPVRKATRDDPDEVAKHLGSRRQIGKFAILGLGFSMGALKCMNQLRADPITASLFNSGVLTPLICRDIVKTYRTRYPRIPQLWGDLEAGFRAAINGQTSTVKGIRFEKSDNVVLVWLPSGRALRYPDAKLSNETRTIQYLDDNGEQAEFTPDGPAIIYGSAGTNLYGGKLTENVVQAIARDILVEAILRLESQGLLVLFHVHDEVVVSVPASESESAKRIVTQVLQTPPAWAVGLPLAAEVTVVERYGK